MPAETCPTQACGAVLAIFALSCVLHAYVTGWLEAYREDQRRRDVKWTIDALNDEHGGDWEHVEGNTYRDKTRRRTAKIGVCDDA